MIVDPKSTVPIFRQIAEQMRSSIEAGVYRSGEALPSLRALAAEIRVNPNTVQRAYEELERQRVIESRRGVGVFVTQRPDSTTRNRCERKIARLLKEAIACGLDGDVAPARIRDLFEAGMASSLEGARRRS